MPFQQFGKLPGLLGTSGRSEPVYRWQAPSLQNSWVNYGSGYIPSGYRELADGGVAMRGLVRNGTAALIFTLPARLAPTGHLIFVCQSSTPSTTRVDVRSNGAVQISGTIPSWVDLTNIVFWNEDR